MHSMTSFTRNTSKIDKPALFVFCVVVLLGTWVALYWWESLFTESHLVGYYCCVSEQDLPAFGTLERTLSDFFRASPGKHLPGLFLLATSATIFAIGLQRARDEHWLLPFLFIVFNILYFGVSLVLVDLSWSLSNTLVGSKMSAYAGYDRTWYGIALHLALWGVFFLALQQTSFRLMERIRTLPVAHDV